MAAAQPSAMGGHEIEGVTLISKRTAKQRFRESILTRWQHCCAYCGGADAATLDHVRPRHCGGQTIERNLVPACGHCNRRKGSDDWREWFSRQVFFCPVRAGRIDGWIAERDAAAS